MRIIKLALVMGIVIILLACAIFSTIPRVVRISNKQEKLNLLLHEVDSLKIYKDSLIKHNNGSKIR